MACALEFKPAKVSVVLDKSTKTRQLGAKRLLHTQVPCYAQLNMTKQLGTISKLDDPQKLEHCGVELFYQEDLSSPLVRLYRMAGL